MQRVLPWLSLLFGSVLAFPAQALSQTGCELSSDVRAFVDGRLQNVGQGFAAGSITFIASRPRDRAIVLLVPDAEGYREVGLYWPTPHDPVYAFRRMARLPYDSTLVANDSPQGVIVLRSSMAFDVGGEEVVYRPINYAGHTLSIDGCGGDDFIYGGEGNDHLYDYAGKNELRGNGGRDWLEGAGHLFAGGAGDDCISGESAGSDAQFYGEAGDDVVTSADVNVRVDGGEGEDACDGTSPFDCETSEPPTCLGWN